MATVMSGPWDKLPAEMAKLVGMIGDFAEEKNEKTDAQLLASTPPDQLAKIMPQLKSQKIRNAAVNAIFADRPRDVYQQQGGQLKKTGSVPGTAEIMKPDPAELEAQREAGRERLESERQAGRLQLEGARSEDQFKRTQASNEYQFQRQQSTQQFQFDLTNAKEEHRWQQEQLKQAGADKKAHEEAGRKTLVDYEKMKQKIESDASKQKEKLTFLDGDERKKAVSEVEAEKASRMKDLDATFHPMLEGYGVKPPATGGGKQADMAAISQSLAGKPAGRYKVDGKVMVWDGTNLTAGQ